MKNNERVYNMSFAGVYQHYIEKAEKKGHSKEEELMRNIRYLDKQTDELTKGKASVTGYCIKFKKSERY